MSLVGDRVSECLGSVLFSFKMTCLFQLECCFFKKPLYLDLVWFQLHIVSQNNTLKAVGGFIPRPDFTNTNTKFLKLKEASYLFLV